MRVLQSIDAVSGKHVACKLVRIGGKESRTEAKRRVELKSKKRAGAKEITTPDELGEAIRQSKRTMG